MRLLLMLLVCASAASAQGPFAMRIESGQSPGTCTAAAIAPDLIVTAAHCLHPGREDYSAHPAKGPSRDLMAIHHHPVFALAPPGRARFRFDVALATLDGAVEAPVLPVGPPPYPGERLAIETFRRHDPVPQYRNCTVIAAPEGEVVLDCAVSHGHSGAPVLRLTGDGAEIVAILTAKVMVQGRPAALGITLLDRIDVLIQAAGRAP